MDGSVTHQDYYSQFVTPKISALVVGEIGMKRLQASKDQHLNDIELEIWDWIGLQFRAEVSPKLKEAGDFVSMAGLVCIAKSAARHVLKENEVAA